jgi:hypothetical protein
MQWIGRIIKYRRNKLPLCLARIGNRRQPSKHKILEVEPNAGITDEILQISVIGAGVTVSRVGEYLPHLRPPEEVLVIA